MLGWAVNAATGVGALTTAVRLFEVLTIDNPEPPGSEFAGLWFI